MKLNLLQMASNGLNHSSPLYVQYYITARCNLRCQQCNVIYANSDVRELQTEQAIQVIENLGRIGTSVLLLTGGEPFVRHDLPILAKTAIENGIHPRIQTNGLASIERLAECAEYGVTDISISLDSLVAVKQDFLNGEFVNSWDRAIETIANVGKTLGENTFAAFGCVFSPYNFREVPSIIKFATEIGWWVSLVPAHTSDKYMARSFSSYNKEVSFTREEIPFAKETIEQVRILKKQGFNVYDSDQFLNDLERFISGVPTTWRDRNDGVCDAGSLYFAVLPDGSLAPCCDWRLPSSASVQAPEFPDDFMARKFQKAIFETASKCSGCLYGSYPEISISARYARAAMERVLLFGKENKQRIAVLEKHQLEEIAKGFRGGF